jgi:hypothetical protein
MASWRDRISQPVYKSETRPELRSSLGAGAIPIACPNNLHKNEPNERPAAAGGLHSRLRYRNRQNTRVSSCSGSSLQSPFAIGLGWRLTIDEDVVAVGAKAFVLAQEGPNLVERQAERPRDLRRRGASARPRRSAARQSQSRSEQPCVASTAACV